MYHFLCAIGFIAAGQLGLAKSASAEPIGRPLQSSCVAEQLHYLNRIGSAHELSPALYQKLLSLQKSHWLKLSKPFEIKTRAGMFTADTYIGGSASAVFLDSRQGKILKFYPLPLNQEIISYEHLVTEYLTARGEKVPRIIATTHTSRAPQIHSIAERHPPDGYTVIIKDYFEGLTIDTLTQSSQIGATFDMNRVRREINQHVERVEDGFFGQGPGTFRMWLGRHHPELPSALLKGNLVQYGDAKEDNFLYIQGEGWVLNDP